MKLQHSTSAIQEHAKKYILHHHVIITGRTLKYNYLLSPTTVGTGWYSVDSGLDGGYFPDQNPWPGQMY